MSSTVPPVKVHVTDIEAAARRLDGIISRTPLERNERLSALTGAHVWLKREDAHLVRSYKLRGAYNFIAGLSEHQRRLGVVCASAGNHAQGVAWACARLQIPARIFVPRTTPRQKRDRIRHFGGTTAELIVTGDTYDLAYQAAANDAAMTGATLVPAFDAPATIAGQGTVGKEILEQLDTPPDLIVVPVGGGGLAAGIATWLTAQAPDVELIGVEAAGSASMTAALAAGQPVPLDHIDSFVDGAAVQTAGTHTFPIIRDHANRLVTVPEGRVCVEMLALYQQDGIITEPAGALASSALGHAVVPEPGSTVVCVISGSNNDVSRYADILERALIHEGRKHYFLVEFPQEPGALLAFLTDVLGPEDDITLFEYVKRNNRETGPALVGLELHDPSNLPALLGRMRRSHCTVTPIAPGDPLFSMTQ